MSCTALGKATRVGHIDTVTLLLMRNAQPNLKDKVKIHCFKYTEKLEINCFSDYSGVDLSSF